MNLLDLFVNVKVSGGGAVAGELAGISSQASKTDKAVGSSMRSIGSSMTRVGKGMSLFVTAPLALAGAAAVKMGAQFDQALTNAVSVTGKTGKAAEQAKNQMNELALTLGAKTAFSAKDAADAMYDLASSGWSVNDMQKGLNGIMALAAATQTDLAEATGTVTATLAAFKLESQDSGHVSDVFTAAINKSRLQMDDLAVGMKYAGPVASGFGLSLEETTAALALMADKGIEGSQAGTTLRAALSSLANPVGQASKALEGLGVDLSTINPDTHSLAEIMKTLGDAGMTTNDAIKIFGREAASGMLAVSQTGVPALKGLTAALKDSGGTAERTAKMQLNTLAGAWQNLSGSLETAAIKFEQQIEPALIAITNALIPFVNRISALNPVVKSLIIGFAAFAAALGPLLVVGGLLLQAWGTIAMVFAESSVTLAGIVAVSIPVIAAVAALAAAGIVLYKNWGRVSPAIERVKKTIMGLINVFKAGFAGNFTKVQQIISKLPAPLQTVAAKIALFGNKLRPVANQIKAFVGQAKTFVNIFKAGFTGNFTKVQQLISKLPAPLQKAGAQMALFGSKVRAVAGTVFRFFIKQAQFVVNWFRKNWPLIQKIGVQTFDGLRKLVGQSLNGLFKLIKGIIGGLIVFWRLNHKEITAIAKAAWNVIKTIVSTTIKVILGIIKATMQILTGDWKGAWNTIKDILKTLWDAMVSLVKSSIKIFVNIVKAGWNTAKALTKDIWEDVKSILSNAYDAIKSATSAAWEAIGKAIWTPIDNAADKVRGFLNGMIGVVNSVLKAFGQDPISLIADPGNPGGTTNDDKIAPNQMGRVRAFARGGIAGPGRMGVVGEGGEREAVVNLERRTPESQQAFRAAARSPNARGHRRGNALLPHGKGEDSLGATMYTWIPEVQSIVDHYESQYPVKANTYSNHPAGFAQPFYRERSMDFWAPGGRGAPIDKGVGDSLAADLIKNVSQLNWLIWQGRMLDGTGWQPFTDHFDHVHATAFAENWTVNGGKGALGGSFGPSLAEQMWNGGVTPPNGWKGAAIQGFLQGLGPVGGLLSAAAGAFPGLSKLLPDSVSGMGSGVLGSAANSFLSGSKGWVHDWIFANFGGSTGSGGFSGGGSPSANRALGKKMLAASNTRGSWEALDALWNRESGWSNTADNPTSLAYGIPQANPGSKMGAEANPPKSDPAAQIGWGLPYIDDRYGSTDAAWQHSQETGWYRDGGFIKQDHPAMVHAGELYMPLEHSQVQRTAQAALGTAELREEIADLRHALVENGVKVSGYGHDAESVIVTGAHTGGLRAMRSREGRTATLEAVKTVDRNDLLSGKRR